MHIDMPVRVMAGAYKEASDSEWDFTRASKPVLPSLLVDDGLTGISMRRVAIRLTFYIYVASNFRVTLLVYLPCKSVSWLPFDNNVYPPASLTTGKWLQHDVVGLAWAGYMQDCQMDVRLEFSWMVTFMQDFDWPAVTFLGMALPNGAQRRESSSIALMLIVFGIWLSGNPVRNGWLAMRVCDRRLVPECGREILRSVLNERAH